jgi:NHS family xanthosine MFS transporter
MKEKMLLRISTNRVWGTIGFIAAMWITNLTGSKANEYQFYIAGAWLLLLGLYAFFLPKCPPKSF